MTLFSVMTVHVAVVQVGVLTIFIDKRNFPGNSEGLPPGPAGAMVFFVNKAAYMGFGNVGFPLNQWLSDGLLVSSVSNSVACVH